jgi:hypothetical protein
MLSAGRLAETFLPQMSLEDSLESELPSVLAPHVALLSLCRSQLSQSVMVQLVIYCPDGIEGIWEDAYDESGRPQRRCSLKYLQEHV